MKAHGLAYSPRIFFWILFAVAASADESKALDASTFQYFVGSWTCDGSFPKSGKKISSTLRFETTLNGIGLMKQHDDRAPDVYRAVEVWVFSAEKKRFNAGIVDNFGGVREFHSPGWEGTAIIWTSADTVVPRQQFAYAKLDEHSFRLDWRVSSDGKQYVVGDTLLCQRQR